MAKSTLTAQCQSVSITSCGVKCKALGPIGNAMQQLFWVMSFKHKYGMLNLVAGECKCTNIMNSPSPLLILHIWPYWCQRNFAENFCMLYAPVRKNRTGLVKPLMGQVLDTGAEIGAGFQKFGAELQNVWQMVNTWGGRSGVQGKKKTERKKKTLCCWWKVAYLLILVELGCIASSGLAFVKLSSPGLHCTFFCLDCRTHRETKRGVQKKRALPWHRVVKD